MGLPVDKSDFLELFMVNLAAYGFRLCMNDGTIGL